MRTLIAVLFTIVMAVSQAQADTQSAPTSAKPAQPVWYYLSGWYLMVPVDASHAPRAATTNGQGFPAPVALPAGVVPGNAPVAAPTIRVRASAQPAATLSDSSGSIWDTPTGNNSTSGSLGSMR